MDLDADHTQMSVPQLLEYQQELTRTRLAVNAKAREVQAELDARAAEIAERRAAEDELLGASRKPPTQELMAPGTASGYTYDFLDDNDPADAGT